MGWQLFSSDKRQQLFGNEAAESEDVERLKQYYFKTVVYDQITVQQPLRILVGHKGTGKSALFKVAVQDSLDGGRLSLLLQESDISIHSMFENVHADLPSAIKIITEKLLRTISQRVLSTVGVTSRDTKLLMAYFDEFDNDYVEFLSEAFNGNLGTVSFKHPNLVVNHKDNQGYSRASLVRA